MVSVIAHGISLDVLKRMNNAALFRVEEHQDERKVLANEAIKEGTELCIFTGSVMDYKETLDLGDKESFALQVEKTLYIYLDPPARYFNHCCEPNCGLTTELKLITLQDIEKNEELRWDYSTSMLEHHWTMVCKCKKDTCRKVVTDFDKLPRHVQYRYLKLGMVQEFIVEQLKLKS